MRSPKNTRVEAPNRGTRWRSIPLFSAAALAFGLLTGACASDYEAIPAGATCLTAPLNCGPNEQCQDGANGPNCACKPGFGGPTCAAICAAGTQDNDGDGTCTATCAAQPCGVHSRCDDTSGTRLCTCAPGYTEKNSVCSFTGIVADPGFAATPPNAWTLTNATLDPAYNGGFDPGQATVDPTNTCAGSAQIRQTFTMPTAAESGPLALRTADRLFTASPPINCGGLCFPIAVHQLLIRSNATFLGTYTDVTFNAAPTSGLFHDRSICLGERWYGRSIELAVTPVTSCGIGGTWRRTLDHISIDESSDCPTPGTVKNGDFEGPGGWTPSNNSAGTTAEVAAGAGTGSSRAGRITATAYCTTATLTGAISPPETSIQNLAIAFDFKLTDQDAATVSLSGQTLARIRGNGVYQNAHVCIPESTKGLSASLSFALVDKSSPSATCDGVTNRELTVDDVKFVSDPKCSMPAILADPGFEDTSFVDPWVGTSGQRIQRFQPGFNSPNAARLSVSKTCQTSSITALASIPTPSAGKGLALAASVRGTLNGLSRLTTNLGSGNYTVPASFAPSQLCLNASNFGVTTPLTMQLYQDSNGGSCDVAVSSSVDLDDLRFVEDATCPH